MFEDAEAIIGCYNGANNRYQSWSLFYHFFNDAAQDHHYDSVHLVAYLASWGMYRGSSALLQDHDYTVHDGAIEIIREPRFAELNDAKLAIYSNDAIIRLLFDLVTLLSRHYKCQGVTPTDTLISKILLGCFACVPAYDINFVVGVRSMGWRIGVELNEDAFKKLIRQLQTFPTLPLQCHQARDYPFFKMVDMYFFQKGLGT